MAQTSLQLLGRVDAKIPRVMSQVEGLTAVLARGEIVRRNSVMPLSEEGRKVRETLLKNDLLSLADLRARKTKLQMETSND